MDSVSALRRAGRPAKGGRGGGRCPHCGRPAARCTCRASPRAQGSPEGVRVRREVKGRAGKTVSVVSGLPLPNDRLRELAAELKRLCGSGGTVRNGEILIQGDHCDALVAGLRVRGYTAKRSGG